MELKISGLTKKYGQVTALNRFTYDFSPGVYGLLGPNGAGKSTLMNIVTGNLKPSEGAVTFENRSIFQAGAEFRKVLGFMPQQQGIYPYFTLERFLYYMAALKGMGRKDAREDIERFVRLVNLEDCLRKRLGSFSGGMKQRALIVQAMLGSPKVIILDEPTAGLDPKERIRIRNLISEMAFDKIVMIATHVVSDIEFVAKEVIFLKKGELLDGGRPCDLCEKLTGKVFEVSTSREGLHEITSKYKVGGIKGDDKRASVRIVSEEAPRNCEYQICKPELEDLYLYYFE